MKGFLSYLILWNLSKGKKKGVDISKDLEERKKRKLSPGTLYPALKELRKKDLISADKDKFYSLTKKGREELSDACKVFCEIFYDMKDMFNCCK